jgi:acyl carrier protein
MSQLTSRAAVLESLHRIAPEVDLDAIEPGAELREELDLDSMDFLSFVDAIHDLTGVDIPECDYPSLQTLVTCTAYLEEHRSDL